MSVKTACTSLPSIGDPRLSPYAPQQPRKLVKKAKEPKEHSPQSPSTKDPSYLSTRPQPSSVAEAFSVVRESVAPESSHEAERSPRVHLLKQQLSQRGRAGSSSLIPVNEASSTEDREPVVTKQHTMRVGLNNLGNTCFMNSSLQCILHIEPLASFFLKGAYVQDLNDKSPTKGAVATSFAHLLSEISKASSGSRINPMQFQKAICIYAPHLLDEQQQDCQEFLRFLLDGMSDDLFRHAKRDGTTSHKRNAILESIVRRSSSFSESVDDSTDDKPLMSASAPLSKVLANSNTGNEKAGYLPSPPDAASRPKSAVAKLRSITAAAHHSDDHDPTQHSPQKVSSLTDAEAIANFEAELSLLGGNDDDEHISLANTLSPRGDSPLNSPDSKNAHGLEDSIGGCMGSIGPDHNEISSDLLETHLDNLSLDDSMDSVACTAPLTQSHCNGDLLSIASETPVKDRPQRNEEHSSMPRALTAENLKEVSDAARAEIAAKQHSESTEDGSSGGAISEEEAARREHDSKYEQIAKKSARESWGHYLKNNDSIITDLFSGQLQSTVECLVCHHRSFCFDPFLDLSVPIPMKATESEAESPDQRAGAKSSKWRRKLTAVTGRRGTSAEYPVKCSLEDCMAKFTADEILEGDNMYTCEKCEKRQRCVRKLAVYKCPEILVVHIKRFQYTSIIREKLFTDVQFPLQGLDMKPFLSTDTSNPYDENAEGSVGTVYDLTGVVHHSGGINGGHYVAHVADGQVDEEMTTGNLPSALSGKGKAATGTADDRSWVCFNDAHVSPISPKHITGPSAYMLFYKLRK